MAPRRRPPSRSWQKHWAWPEQPFGSSQGSPRATRRWKFAVSVRRMCLRRWLSDAIEQPAPPNGANEIEDRTVRIGREIDEQGPALDVRRRKKAPVPAVLRIVAIVTHHEVLTVRNGDRTVFLAQVTRLRRRVLGEGLEELDVGLVELIAIDVHQLPSKLQTITRQADHALDQIAVRLLRGLEHDDVAALDVAPRQCRSLDGG